MIKENDYCVKDFGDYVYIEDSFSMKFGMEALKGRQIFAEFFFASKLAEYTPIIHSTLVEVLDCVAKEFSEREQEFPEGYSGDKSLQADGFKSTNIEAILSEAFSTIVDRIIFGTEKVVRINGKSLTEYVGLLFSYGYNDVVGHPANLLTGGLASKMGLIEANKIAKKLEAEIE